MNPYLTTMQVAALAAAGMCHALLGSIKVPLARRLKIEESRVGGLVGVFGFTLIPMAFAAGVLADSLGRDAVISGGCVLLILSVLLLATLENYSMAVVAVLLLGTGWSALVNVLNATQGPSFLSESHVAKQNLPYAMNLGDFIFGMGAFVMPMATSAALRSLGIKRTFFAFAAILVVPLVLSLLVDVDQFVQRFAEILKAAEPAGDGSAKSAAAQGIVGLLTDPFVWLCCLAFFLHVPVEACVATWATTLMIDRGVQERNAALLLSAFWLTFTVSRLIAALAFPAGQHGVMVVVLAVLLVGVILGLVASRKPWQTCALLIAAGMILGPIFPILIAFLVGHVDVSVQGRAIGLFFCIGGVGWAVIPFLVGKLADRSGVQKAFLLVAGCAGGLVVMCGVLAAMES